MTSYAQIIPLSRDDRAIPRELSGTWRRHAFVFPAIFIAMMLCFWFATAGNGKLLYPEYFCGFYDAQSRSLLHGRLDVPPKAIGFEAFDHAGKTYGYFGITPALPTAAIVG